MKKYDCFYEHNGMFRNGKTVEAESAEDALRVFTESSPNEEYPTVRIEWGWGILGISSFLNPNYNEPQKAEADEQPPQQPARTDGSVGWYDKLGKSSLSDRDILLAQLHELRTIKRCVVCTILIVIVIPIVFGVIR